MEGLLIFVENEEPARCLALDGDGGKDHEELSKGRRRGGGASSDRMRVGGAFGEPLNSEEPDL